MSSFRPMTIGDARIYRDAGGLHEVTARAVLDHATDTITEVVTLDGNPCRRCPCLRGPALWVALEIDGTGAQLEMVTSALKREELGDRWLLSARRSAVWQPPNTFEPKAVIVLERVPVTASGYLVEHLDREVSQ